MNNKNIWIFHHYAAPKNMNGSSRPYDFSVNLSKVGYKTKIFAASYLHFSGINLINNKELYITNNDLGVPFIFINTPSSSGNGLKRVLNIASYYNNLHRVTKKLIKDGEKPDLIIASSPHPLAMVAGIKIAKKLGIPCVSEVRDFWPEVFFTGGKLKEHSFIGRILVEGERWIYEKSDAIIFLKEGDHTYITDKKWDLEQGGSIDLKKCHYINNGVDIENFNRQISEDTISDVDLNDNKFNVVYTGAIRPVNNVGNILDTAKLLMDTEDIQFLIFGDGNQVELLKKRIKDEKITNVKMKGYINKKFIPYVLSKSSVNILNYSQTQYNWSRGNSSNKLFEYMASGKPIISTVKMGYSIIDKYNCGLELENSTPEELAKAILKIKEMPMEEFKRIGDNAKKGAEEFDFKILTEKLIQVIEKTYY